MADRVLRVALTGGIATGKSHCLRRFEALGVPCIDADRLAHEAAAPGSAGLAAIVRRFGPSLLAPDGTLDRKALARLVFADEAARRDLEAILHPIVYDGIVRWFEGLSAGPAATGDTPGRQGFAVADVPLLFETGRDAEFDRVVVAACRPDQQLARLQARDGLSEAEARARLAAQWPIDWKRERADYVIETSGTPADTDQQVDAAAARLEAVSRKP